MLEAGADFSLPNIFDGDFWVTGFQRLFLNCQEATFEHILKLGVPFVSPNMEILDDSGNARLALSYLAEICGYMTSDLIQIVDKAILLLKGNADITYRDAHGDTVLHTLLSCHRMHEERGIMSLYSSQCGCGKRQTMAGEYFLSLTEPRQLLIVFLSASADVYAVNQKGETPSSVAKQCGREDEWNEALTACGYDSKEISAHTKLGSFGNAGKRQSPHLSFEDVCRKRQEYLMFKKRFFEERCRGCSEPFHPSLISFDEECRQCGEKFWYREESLDSQYEPLREQYLRDKDTFTRYRQRRKQSVDEECLRSKRACFEEHCRDCGFQFQPEPNYFPEDCLQCGKRIGRRRGPMDACFKECLVEYRCRKKDYRRAKWWRNQNLDGDNTPSD